MPAPKYKLLEIINKVRLVERSCDVPRSIISTLLSPPSKIGMLPTNDRSAKELCRARTVLLSRTNPLRKPFVNSRAIHAKSERVQRKMVPPTPLSAPRKDHPNQWDQVPAQMSEEAKLFSYLAMKKAKGEETKQLRSRFGRLKVEETSVDEDCRELSLNVSKNTSRQLAKAFPGHSSARGQSSILSKSLEQYSS
ncbi:hypothetical protein BDU57DRAFT_287618 [Ampelomyces quisqualis]|uniref:Uncharacterized protein n=1 Tax=Ampelomyces quisqualis TaxID=50730 RepID=A0A6A5QFI7_AMPQU|nr:hypothetical protein BDU57DRAFT_287618 [Ampelomyces quisqualis]